MREFMNANAFNLWRRYIAENSCKHNLQFMSPRGDNLKRYPIMMITTKGRNALKVMLDLAQHDDGAPVPLAEIAERVHESQKYLESTVSQLSQNGLIHSSRGKSGGYRLARTADKYTVAEIITAAEGSLAPVSCLSPDKPCENADKCLTMPLWRELDEVIMNFLNSKSLADLLK